MAIKYDVCEETLLKAMILTGGIEFSESALLVAYNEGAKGQNLVYNMPINATSSRPQELIIRNMVDGYEVVVSCVSPNPKNDAVFLDVDADGRLIALVDGNLIQNIEIHYVKEPQYYREKLRNGDKVKRYVSACGMDELNIIPWKGCAISKGCRFCGINNFINPDELSAHTISKEKGVWEKNIKEYLTNLTEAVSVAIQSDCYNEHTHVILIAGNLSNEQLDIEADIFSKIAYELVPVVSKKSTEGIVLVITPPESYEKIEMLKSSGISKVVFNLEAITPSGFEKYCPGKANLGYQYFIDRLLYAINVFGDGNVWTNLVFGLEPEAEILELCDELIKKGIVISANVLHLDKGNTLDCGVPSTAEVIDFFYKLEEMNRRQGHNPFYCAKALRTSLSNEAHDFRIREKDMV